MSPSAKEILIGEIDEARVSFEKGAVQGLEGNWKDCTSGTLYQDGDGKIHLYVEDPRKAITDCDINPNKDIFTVEE